MKKILCVLIVFFVGISTLVFAKTSTIISQKNEYGGKTIIVTYSPGDEEYESGTAKDITYFGSNEKKVKTESFYTEESIRHNTISKGITYFDGDEKEVKMDIYGKDRSLLK